MGASFTRGYGYPTSVDENYFYNKELSPGHILYGKRAVAVARRQDKDDVVYWLNELDKYAIVHLTYNKENSSGFPKTELFTLGELEKHCKEVSKFY